MRESGLSRAITEFLGVAIVAFDEAKGKPLEQDDAAWLTATAEMLRDLVKRDDALDLTWSKGAKD